MIYMCVCIMELFLLLVLNFLLHLQVANFCSAEDDGTFWSRWIKPDAIAQADVCTRP